MPTFMRESVHVEGFHALHICPAPNPWMLHAAHVYGVLLPAISLACWPPFLSLRRHQQVWG